MELRDWPVALSPELMLKASPGGTILSTNRGWMSMLGWSEPELSNTKLLELVHPDDRQKTVEGVQRIGDDVCTSTFCVRLRHKDGTYHRIAWTAVAGEDCLLARGRDDTESAVASLRESPETLRQLQRVDSAGQLIGGVSHEFNNLLQSIFASLELTRKLIDLNRIAETEKFVTKAMTAAQRAAALHRRLVGLSRRLPPDPRPVAINALIGDMHDLLRAALPPSISIDLALGADVWNAYCDANQAETAIASLVLNARDAMPQGGTLTIATGNVERDHERAAGSSGPTSAQCVSIAVTDSGTGMSPEIVRLAPEDFFTTKPRGLAIGLGLTMVRGFARECGGDMEIDSEMGRGTTVTIYLPRAADGSA